MVMVPCPWLLTIGSYKARYQVAAYPEVIVVLIAVPTLRTSDGFAEEKTLRRVRSL